MVADVHGTCGTSCVQYTVRTGVVAAYTVHVVQMCTAHVVAAVYCTPGSRCVQFMWWQVRTVHVVAAAYSSFGSSCVQYMVADAQ